MLLIVMVAACSTGPGSSGQLAGTAAPPAPPAATTAPASATPPPPTPTTPATVNSPKPTLALPHPIDLLKTTATKIDAGPSPDFIVLAGEYAFVSGIGNGIGRFDQATG